MIRYDRVKRNVARMMRRFPSETVQLYRPRRDAYGQPTGERDEIGAAECWREGVNRPSAWEMRRAGMAYDDEGATWICLLLTDATPEARHEDVARFADGREAIVRNTYQTGTRAYWQLDMKGSE